MILSFFNKGHERTIKTKRNIFFLILIKLAGILTTLLLVPITINYVNKEAYGVWLTVSSIVAWIALFDVGLGNGMRNKFALAISQNDLKKARSYVSTTFFSLTIIFILLWLFFVYINRYLDWCSLLNIKNCNVEDVNALVFIVITYFCIQFILRTINTVLIANQEPAKASFIDVLGQILALITIYILTKTTTGSLIHLGLGLTIPPLVVLIIANIFLFGKKYRKYAPDYHYVDSFHFKDIFGLSIKFFVIQVAALIQYQTANIIIARSFSNESVVDYNLVYKYFNVLLMGFMILLTPFWSAATEAFSKKDHTWINNMVKRYKQIWILFLVIGIIMLSISSFAYELWVNKDVTQTISFLLSFCGFLYIITTMFGAIFVQLLNGIGAVKIQYYCSIVSPFLFLSLCFIFINHFHMGVYSLFVASVISNFNGIVLAPLQYKKIFIQGKGGVWIAT